ncbi:MAG TPA: class I SAM-dependent methyltransferase [Candidatus Aphodocola excrementigallinarum]|uniref:Class I SAM-dependent methyltransferase n=1 Tax=Candidatus Aphodocola excrementigallinarum TaxID=2840670 RepID=A0A9D1IQK2_9FIRM|nr:class I SAM-dependent methyltransferase [Candidatus Aphodocola excrementigallinarum]
MAHYFTNDENLKSEIRKVSVVIHSIGYYFYTDNGVFSKNKLDAGTELLLNTFKYTYPQEKTFLDIGCGCGAIGIYASLLGFTVDMSDVNKRAIHLSKMSIKEQNLNANVFLSDAYENIDKKYDYIVSNPPIRVGKKKLYEIIMYAKDHLKENGELWIVVRKKQGADSLVKDMKEVYKLVEVVLKKKGYYIIMAKEV